MEKISIEFGEFILKTNGLQSLINYIDFFELKI